MTLWFQPLVEYESKIDIPKLLQTQALKVYINTTVGRKTRRTINTQRSHISKYTSKYTEHTIWKQTNVNIYSKTQTDPSMSNLALVCTNTFSQWLCFSLMYIVLLEYMFSCSLCNVYSYYRRAHPNIKYRKKHHTKSIWWKLIWTMFSSSYDISQSFFALSHNTQTNNVYYKCWKQYTTLQTRNYSGPATTITTNDPHLLLPLFCTKYIYYV